MKTKDNNRKRKTICLIKEQKKVINAPIVKLFFVYCKRSAIKRKRC